MAGDWLQRTEVLLGGESMEKLSRASVYVFGLGAVGSYAVEGLARSGVGMLRLVDFDSIKESNCNRQLYALRSTLGRAKSEAARERVLDINPACQVEAVREFAQAESLESLLAGGPDLIIDAIDSLNPKVDLIQAGDRLGVPVFSALGAATRLDCDAIHFGRLFKAEGCPLGRLVRKRLRRRGIHDGDLWCVYSDEDRNLAAVRERDQEEPGDEEEYRRGRDRRVLGSIATVTGIFGLRLAHEAVLRLVGGWSGLPD